MRVLAFENPTHRIGRNVTVRRGVRWAVETMAAVQGLDAMDGSGRPISTQVFRFCDLRDIDIADEHDGDLRTVIDLEFAMCRMYPGFSPFELVTLVAYHNSKAKVKA